MIPEWDSLSSNTGGSLRLKFTVFFMFSVTFLVTFEVVSRHFRSRSAWSRIYRRASLPLFHTYFYVSFFLCFRLLQSRCLSCLRRVYSLPKTEGYIPPVHHSATIGLINDLWSLCCQGSEQVEVSFILEKMKGTQKFGLDLDIHRSLFPPPPPRLWSSSKCERNNSRGRTYWSRTLKAGGELLRRFPTPALRCLASLKGRNKTAVDRVWLESILYNNPGFYLLSKRQFFRDLLNLQY